MKLPGAVAYALGGGVLLLPAAGVLRGRHRGEAAPAPVDPAEEDFRPRYPTPDE
ncbi:hypothetical protein [Streptomyces sp. H27-C3]|uniref:hypothetical protein n=1 Tax=Streptomyces sp. H27-C3 TaxID=3046305 RepID=UPI0024BBB83E|nr:hypothetical protein [Streptomyces sp. H27-C3]MDJ0466622.1 hypothetical protein [Streptomyces sp. H27-C3]